MRSKLPKMLGAFVAWTWIFDLWEPGAVYHSLQRYEPHRPKPQRKLQENRWTASILTCVSPTKRISRKGYLIPSESSPLSRYGPALFGIRRVPQARCVREHSARSIWRPAY